MQSAWMMAQKKINHVKDVLNGLEKDNTKKVIQEKMNLVESLLHDLEDLQASAHQAGEAPGRQAIIEEALVWGKRLMDLKKEYNKAEF